MTLSHALQTRRESDEGAIEIREYSTQLAGRSWLAGKGARHGRLRNGDRNEAALKRNTLKRIRHAETGLIPLYLGG